MNTPPDAPPQKSGGWRARRRVPDAAIGRVLGTDGDARFAGFSLGPEGWGHAVVWQDGTVIDLGRPLTGRSVAQDVNRSGGSVGHATDDLDYQHAILWRGRTAVRLAEPPGAVQTVAVAGPPSDRMRGARASHVLTDCAARRLGRALQRRRADSRSDRGAESTVSVRSSR